jgi:hypothetical protein
MKYNPVAQMNYCIFQKLAQMQMWSLYSDMILSAFSETVDVVCQLSNRWCYFLLYNYEHTVNNTNRSKTGGVLAYHEQLLVHVTTSLVLW